MLKAKDIMTKDVVSVDPEATLEDAIRILLSSKISGMPVCDKERRVLGVISEKDIVSFIFSGNVKTTKVKEAMSTKITSFPPDADIDKISLTMGEKVIRRVPIIENGKLVGIISRRSILRTVLKDVI